MHMPNKFINHCINKEKMVAKLVVLPAGKSKVWQHFGFKVDSEEKIISLMKVHMRDCCVTQET